MPRLTAVKTAVTIISVRGITETVSLFTCITMLQISRLICLYSREPASDNRHLKLGLKFVENYPALSFKLVLELRPGLKPRSALYSACKLDLASCRPFRL